MLSTAPYAASHKDCLSYLHAKCIFLSCQLTTVLSSPSSPLSAATQSVYPSAHSLPPLLHSQSPLPGIGSGHVAGIIHSCGVLCSLVACWRQSVTGRHSSVIELAAQICLRNGKEAVVQHSTARGVRKKALKLLHSYNLILNPFPLNLFFNWSSVPPWLSLPSLRCPPTRFP